MHTVLARWMAALAAAAFLTTTAWAGSAAAGGQAPGWFRMKLGQFEVTALNDGTIDLPVDQLLLGITPERLNDLLGWAYQKPPVETSVNGFLVNTGTKLVLIDTGAGTLFGPTVGRLMANLKASGYQPEQVDEIYITHMHGDHVGGLIGGATRAFPNAVVRAEVHEGDFWLSEKNMKAAPEAMQRFFKGAMAALNPYVAAGKFKPFSGETELVPGVRAMPAFGHTPGHTTYAVESEGQRIVMWGDLMHVAAVQFPMPTVTIRFDTHPELAGPVRARLFADAAAQGYYVAVAHVSFPGIGHLRSDGSGGYRWLPVNYLRAR